MTPTQFFAALKTATDGFGDMKQGIFGFHEGSKYFLSDSMKVVEVDPILYRQTDIAFGQVYDDNKVSSPELDDAMAEAGL
jgi:hypothetical protein